MNQLVKLRIRPSRDGLKFIYMLDYINENGKRKRVSLGHANKRKAEKQRLQVEHGLRMGILEPESMRLSDFLKDSLLRTGNQVRESTKVEYQYSMKHFIKVVGNIDYQNVKHKHGELFIQTALDSGNSIATVSKKIRQLKRIFQLAVQRNQIEVNPLRNLRSLKTSKKKVRIYKPDECRRILKAAHENQDNDILQWDLIITLALTTAMRKSELLNTIWPDIDFEAKTIEVSPKNNTTETWKWDIKDTDRRTLPLTDNTVSLLAELQSRCPNGYPYVFIPPARYDHIQQLRKQGKWKYCDSRNKIINNFTRQFKQILKSAGIKSGQFHDFRRTDVLNDLRTLHQKI